MPVGDAFRDNDAVVPAVGSPLVASRTLIDYGVELHTMRRLAWKHLTYVGGGFFKEVGLKVRHTSSFVGDCEKLQSQMESVKAHCHSSMSGWISLRIWVKMNGSGVESGIAV